MQHSERELFLKNDDSRLITYRSHIYVRLAGLCSALFVLLGCATSDLSGPDYSGSKAALELFPMATSEASTRCMIAAIDGQDVRDRQSWRLTTEYLIPSGQHTYKFTCEDSLGSVAVRGYSFDLEFSVSAEGRYGLTQQRRTESVCFLVQDLAGANDHMSVLAEHCLQ